MADFSVTSCTVSRTIVAPEDTIDITMTIKNTSGGKVTKTGLRLYFTNADRDLSGEGGWAPVVQPEASCSWANGASKTLTWSITPDTIMSQPLYASLYASLKTRLESVRTLPFRLEIVGTDSAGSYLSLVYTISGVKYIDMYYNPQITFDTWRYPNDEATALATTLRVQVASGANADNFNATMYYAQNARATTSSPVRSLNVSRDVLFGVGYSANTSVIPGTYSISSVYTFLLVVTDGYETATSLVTVDRAFANMHLSGKTTGGVAFGRFSSSTQGSPKLESDFPAYFYGGIADLGMNWVTLTPASGVTTPNSNYYGGGALCVAKVGGHVFIRGSVQAKSGAQLTTLPAGYYPTDGNRYKLVPCAGSRIARLYVNTSGIFNLEWVRSLSNGDEYTTAVWVDCNFDYWID